ncbi:MAG TPA: hypothetical protein VHA77_02275 [Xanthobacteraceae bacterium]|jgi:hypothetical protein|nr:hypothetical protein [Xanthobacteraceae bacterium]
MVHVLDKTTLVRANRALLLGAVGSGLAACALGALAYDVGRWFNAW